MKVKIEKKNLKDSFELSGMATAILFGFILLIIIVFGL
jgi:hypothetical protein